MPIPPNPMLPLSFKPQARLDLIQMLGTFNEVQNPDSALVLSFQSVINPVFARNGLKNPEIWDFGIKVVEVIVLRADNRF